MKSTSRIHRCVTLAAAATGAAWLVPVNAQTSTAPSQLGTVVVEGEVGPRATLDTPASTGSRLGLTPRETPATIDVITREAMRERGDNTVEQALRNSAGVATGQCFGFTCFSVRGFSGNLQITQLQDGLRYPGAQVVPRTTFNYERVEVLKGPSSLQHGFGSIGGAINYISKAADGREERELQVGYDRWDTRRLAFGVGGKATPAVSYRLDLSHAGGHKGSFGYVDRSDYDYYQITGAVSLAATDRLKVTLSTDNFDDRGQGYFGTPHVGGVIDERVRKRNYNVEDGVIQRRVYWLRLKLDYALTPSTRLVNESYGNHEDRKWRNAEAYAYAPATGRVDRFDFLHIRHKQKFAGNRTDLVDQSRIAGMANKLVVGVDVSRNRHQRDNNSPYLGDDTVDFLNPVPGRFSSPSPYSPMRRTEVDNVAVYVEDQLSVTPALKLLAGVRRERVDVDSFDLRANNAFFNKRYSGTSGQVGFVYQVTPAASVYGQFGRSLEAPVQIVTLRSGQDVFDPSAARQVELGVKADIAGAGGPLGEVTASVYKTTRTNLTTRDPANPALTVQIGQQSAQGIELSAALRPTRPLTVGAAVSVLRAQFDDFIDSVAGRAVSRAGLLPPDVPERTASVYGSYQLTPALRAGTGIYHVGRRTANNANTLFMPAYTTVDAHVALKLGPGTVYLRGRNLADKVYATRSYGGGSQYLLGEPRAVELSYSARF